MTATELLVELRRLQVPILVLDGRLRVRAGLLAPELRDEVRSHRDDLITLLTVPTHPCSSCGRFAFPRPTVCHWCRREGGGGVDRPSLRAVQEG